MKKIKLRRSYRLKYYHLDRFAVYHGQKRLIVQTEFNVRRACRVARVLNKHEVDCGRQPVYQVTKLDQVEVTDV